MSIVEILEKQSYILEDNLHFTYMIFKKNKTKVSWQKWSDSSGNEKGKIPKKKKKKSLMFWKLPKLLILYSWLSWKLAQREIWAYLGDGKQQTDLRTVSSSCDSVETDAKSKYDIYSK